MMFNRGTFNHDMFFGHGYWGSGWNWLIGLGLVLIIVAVTYLIVKNNKKTVSNSSAIESLKIKFVQGEITQEEYTKRKNVLEG